MIWPIPMASDLACHLLTNCLHSATTSLLFLEHGAYFHQWLTASPCTLKDFHVFTLLALSGHSISAQLSPQWPPLTTWFHAVSTPPSILYHWLFYLLHSLKSSYVRVYFCLTMRIHKLYQSSGRFVLCTLALLWERCLTHSMHKCIGVSVDPQIYPFEIS